MQRIRYKQGRRPYLAVGVSGDSDSLLELEPTRSKYRGLLSYNILDGYPASPVFPIMHLASALVRTPPLKFPSLPRSLVPLLLPSSLGVYSLIMALRQWCIHSSSQRCLSGALISSANAPPPRIRFWRILKNPTIDTCNEYDRNTVDARTVPWVSAATPRAF